MITTNKYELVIGKSVGPIRLGEPRQSIIFTLGEPESSRVGRLNKTDYYDNLGIFIDYRLADELCQNISIAYPSQLIYEGRDLIFCTWVEIVRWLAQLDPTAEEAGDGWKSNALGIEIHPKYNDDGTYQRTDFINVFDLRYWASDEEIEAERKRRASERPSEEDCLRELGLDASIFESLSKK
jgi:hypothetical protein